MRKLHHHLSFLNKSLIHRFSTFLSTFWKWFFYSFDHNFWSTCPNLINDPSKFKLIFPVSNAKEFFSLIFVELEKTEFKVLNFFNGQRIKVAGLCAKSKWWGKPGKKTIYWHELVPSARQFFFENPAPSYFRHYHFALLCKKSWKSVEHNARESRKTVFRRFLRSSGYKNQFYWKLNHAKIRALHLRIIFVWKRKKT